MKTAAFFFNSISNNDSFVCSKKAIWYFGESAGLDFNSEFRYVNWRKAYKRRLCNYIWQRRKLLLYWWLICLQQNHKIMANGYGLLGNRSSTQSAIIVPKKPICLLYFHRRRTNELNTRLPLMTGTNDGLNYSQVDMRLNNGLGDVVTTEKTYTLSLTIKVTM
jgi:hypothetical protein